MTERIINLKRRVERLVFDNKMLIERFYSYVVGEESIERMKLDKGAVEIDALEKE